MDAAELRENEVHRDENGVAHRGENGVPIEQLEAQITELAGHLNAAQYRWLALIAEFDRRLGWAGAQLASCAHWLNFKCGIALGAAREKVRVAHALEHLPRLAGSMARGELSYSKVRALTRIVCPATEETLLMIALHGTAHHVESLVRLYRRAREADALSQEARQQETRCVYYYHDEDGSLVLKARLPAVTGAIVVKAMEAAIKEVPWREVVGHDPAEEIVSHQSRRADALGLIAEGYLQSRTDSSADADRHQLVIHVDAESLEKKCAGRSHVEAGAALPIETVRRLGCDASTIEVLENHAGEPLDVGRKTRRIPPAIRRALRARDTGCCFPGCTFKQHLDAHHIEHWADGGATRLDNLLTLCRWHHRTVHEGGIQIERRAEGGWRFVKPDGTEFETLPLKLPASYVWSDLEEANLAQGIVIDSDTAATRWRGERMDYDLGVSGLCYQAAAHAADPGRSRGNVEGDQPFG
jgi:hypothetical protein